MSRVPRKDITLEEVLDLLDMRFAQAGGNLRKAFSMLTTFESEFINGEIEKCVDFRYYAENYHVIGSEDEGFKTLYPFWDSQEILYEKVVGLQQKKLPVKIIVLKARQLGSSTLSEALIFHKTIFSEGCQTIVVAQDPGQADYLFGMSRTAYDSLPWWMRPEARYEAKGRYLTFDRKDPVERLTNPGLKSQIWVEAANKMCLCPGNQVLSTRGLIPIETIVPGDFVYDPNCNPVKVVAALSKISPKKKGRKVTAWLNAAFPISGTDDHPIVTNHGLKDLKDIRVGDDCLVLPFRKITSGSSIPFPRMNRHAQERLRHVPIPRPDREWGFLCGLYLAEGSVSKKGMPVSLALCSDEKHLAERFSRACGVPLSSPIETGRSLVYRIHSSWLGTWLSQQFGEVDNKRIPEWVFGCGKEFCLGVLEGMIFGDGHFLREHNGIVFVTTRPLLAVQIRELALSLGFGLGGIMKTKTQWDYKGERKVGVGYRVAFDGDVAISIRTALSVRSLPVKDHLRNHKKWGWIHGSNAVWVEVKSTEICDIDVVYDIQVDSKDHLYLLPATITHNTGVGVGKTVHAAHMSEISNWPNDEVLAEQLFPTMNAADELAILESTARGRKNFWHTFWMAAWEGKVEWTPVFIEFFRVKKYSLPIPEGLTFVPTKDEEVLREKVEEKTSIRISNEQFYWRRKKMEEFSALQGNEFKFYQEYPSACLVESIRYSCEKGIVGIGEDIGAKRTESGPIAHWHALPSYPVFTLKTKAGRVLTGTMNHPVKVIVRIHRGVPRYEWKWLGELEKGDVIVLCPPMFAEHEHTIIWSLPGKATGSLVVDNGLASLLGYFMGDGSWYNHEIDVCCDREDGDVFRDVDRLLAEYIKKPSKPKEFDGARTVRCYALSAFDWLLTSGCIDGKKRVVCVPECVWRSPKSVVREFLCSLFECDGSVHKNGTVRFHTKHEKFAQDLQLLLLGFGIPVNIYPTYKNLKGKNHVGYDLWMSLAASEKFFNEIGFRGERKNGLRTKVYKASAYRNSGRKRAPIEMRDEVVSVEAAGEAPVFDLTMATEEHAFSANGILTHNTWMEAFQGSGVCAFNRRKLQYILETRCCDPRWYGEIELEIKGEKKKEKFRLVELYDKDDKGNFTTRKETVMLPAQEEYGGRLYLWEPPQEGETYYIGVDVAHGVPGGDFSVAQVLKIGHRTEPDEQVAEWRGWINPGPFAHVCCALGYWYNGAQLSIECNDVGQATNAEVMRVIQYENLFRWKHYDKIKNFMTDYFGWFTNSKTRDLIIAKFREYMDENMIILRSEWLIDECLDFSSVEGSRFEGQATHDDRIMAAMIAVFCAHDSEWGTAAALAPRVKDDPKEGWRKKDFINSDFSPVYDAGKVMSISPVGEHREVPRDFALHSELSVEENDAWRLL